MAMTVNLFIERVVVSLELANAMCSTPSGISASGLSASLHGAVLLRAESHLQSHAWICDVDGFLCASSGKHRLRSGKGPVAKYS